VADLRPGGFTTRLVEASSRLPNPLLSHEGGPDVVPFAPPRPARVTCFRSATDSESPKTPAFDRIDFQPLPGLTEEEFAELDLPSTTNLNLFNPSAEPVSGWKTSRDWCMRLGLSLALFRLRAEVTRLADAHLVFGGREYGAKGRFPGVAEEVMLSLAAGAAVYICGGFGGGAHAVGRVLGLGDPWFSVPDCLRVEKHGSGAATLESAVKGWGSRFQLTHSEDLPLDYAGLVDFLRSHSVDGSRWPNNGLTAEENRSLFRATNADEIIHAVTTGLRRRFGNAR